MRDERVQKRQVMRPMIGRYYRQPPQSRDDHHGQPACLLDLGTGRLSLR